MASDNVLQITDDSFEEQVLNSPVPVLVDFWAEWCMPCKMLAPTIDELADEYAGKVKVGKVDTESNRAIAVQYGISAIPTVMLFKGGELVRSFVGMQSKRDFKVALDELLA